MWLPIGWAKGPSSLPYSANVNLTARLSVLAVRKKHDPLITVETQKHIFELGHKKVFKNTSLHNGLACWPDQVGHIIILLLYSL